VPDAHARQCRLVDGLLETNKVLIEDRHFCTGDFLVGLIDETFFRRPRAGSTPALGTPSDRKTTQSMHTETICDVLTTPDVTR